MNQNIRGISTRKVCPLTLLPKQVVRSYRTFSPLPQQGAVIFCDTFLPLNKLIGLSFGPFIKWYGTLRCPDFPRCKPTIANFSRDGTVCNLKGVHYTGMLQIIIIFRLTKYSDNFMRHCKIQLVLLNNNPSYMPEFFRSNKNQIKSGAKC